MFRQRTGRWAGLALAGFAACASTAPEGADAWRAKLAAEPPNAQGGEARQALADAEWQRAREAHTIAAYARFLEEFPSGAHTEEATALLETLRFDAASAEAGTAALSAFLQQHPAGAHAAVARELVAKRSADAALASGDAKAVRAALAAYPASARRAELEARLDDLDVAAVADAPGLRAYLEAHPSGRHRAEVLRRLGRAELDEAIAAGDAKALAKLAQGAGALALEARAAAAELDVSRAEALLDASALHSLGETWAGTPAGARAADEGKAWAKAPGLAALTAWARALADRGDVATLELELTGAVDPRDRAAAALRLGATGDAGALGALVVAAASPFVLVQRAAAEGALALAAALPRAGVVARLGPERAQLASMARTPPLYLRAALAAECAGDAEAARTMYISAEDESETPYVLPLSRGAALAAAAGDRLGAALRSRKEAALALAVAEVRGPKPAQLGATRTMALRQLCGAVLSAHDAAARLGELAAGAAGKEADELAQWARDAGAVAERLSGRLAEQEGAGAPACELESVRAQLKAAAGARARAAAALGALGDARAKAALSRAAATDPDRSARAAAAAALARLGGGARAGN